MARKLTPNDQRERARAWLAFGEVNGRQPGNKPDAPQSESALYYWINKHRKADTAGALSADTRTVLDEVAPAWREPADPSRPNPELHARRAVEYRAFHEEHGRTPSQLARRPSERQLQHWMTNQRATLAAGRLSPEVHAVISAMLPGWDAPSGKTPREPVVVVPFAERLAALRTYMEANSGLLPPANGGDGSLGRWLAQQRRLWRRGELKRARKRALDGLTPTWMHERRNDAKWNRRAADFAAFVAEHGRLPGGTRRDEAERQLNTWMHSQRRAELSDEQVATLDSTAPDWRGDGVPSGWAARVREIEAFIREHGHRPRPQGATPEERRMGFWLTRQRRALRESALSEAEIALLSEALPGWESPVKTQNAPRGPRAPRPERAPHLKRERTPKLGRVRQPRRITVDDLIERAQRDVTNRYPVLALDDPFEYTHRVVRRYLRLAARVDEKSTLQSRPGNVPLAECEGT